MEILSNLAIIDKLLVNIGTFLPELILIDSHRPLFTRLSVITLVLALVTSPKAAKLTKLFGNSRREQDQHTELTEKTKMSIIDRNDNKDAELKVNRLLERRFEQLNSSKIPLTSVSYFSNAVKSGLASNKTEFLAGLAYGTRYDLQESLIL